MKKFRWILLSGLLVATTQIAQAQDPGRGFSPSPSGGGSFDPRGGSPSGGPGSFGAPGGSAVGDAGAISNTTTTTTTTGVAPDSSGGGFVPAGDAALGSSDSSTIPDTGGEPMIAVLAGLSIAGAALAMRRKVTA